MPQRIQSFLFPKARWTVAQAQAWLREHGYKAPAPDMGGESARFMRFRQFPPGRCEGNPQQLTQNFPRGIQAFACNVPARESSLVEVSESSRSLVSAVHTLQEGAFDAAKGIVRFRIIQPGFNTSKSKFYSPEAISRDHGVFKGNRMFVDHATDRQDRERPEGSIRDWAGNLNRTWVEEDGSAWGEGSVIDEDLKSRLKNLAEHNQLHTMGISIRAIGTGHSQEIEGTKTLVVDSFLQGRSVDFVTSPGAGGGVALYESEGSPNDVDLLSVEEILRRRPEVKKLLKGGKETMAEEKTIERLQEQLQEAQARVAELEAGDTQKQLEAAKKQLQEAQDQIKDLEKKQRITEAKGKVKDLIEKAELPDASKKKLLAKFEEAESAEGVEAAIKEEADYLKTLGVKFNKTPKPKPADVTNLGEAGGSETEPKGDDAVDLVEAFKARGMTEDEAKVAARGY